MKLSVKNWKARISAYYLQSALVRMLLYHIQYTRSGSVLVASVIGLGVLVIVIPLIYLITATVGNTIPTGNLNTNQTATLHSLVNTGGQALQLTSVTETVVGAGIIILGIYLFFQFRSR